MRKILIFILALFSFSAIYSHTVVFDNYWKARACKTCGKILVDMWGVDSVVRFLAEQNFIGLKLYCDSSGYVDSVMNIRPSRMFDANAKEQFNAYFAKYKVLCEYYSDAYYDWDNRNNHNQYIVELDSLISNRQSRSDGLTNESGYQEQFFFPGELSDPSRAEDDGYEDLTRLERVLMRLDIPLDSINLEDIDVDSVGYLF